MAEVNPTAARRAPPPVQSQPQVAAQAAAPKAHKAAPMTNREANRITGLGSGLNTDQTVETLITVERKRLEPVQELKTNTQMELESFKIIRDELEKVQNSAKSLTGNSIWEGKLVSSSNENVVKATATTGAKPGKHTLIVDKLALNHQIASQGYETQDAQVGIGKFKLTVGEGNPITVTIDNSNNTLTGLKDAINFASQEASATIIKTGNREKPYQLVLTSQKTGTQGRLKPEVDLKGATAPVFQNSVEEPSLWKGVGEAAKTGFEAPKGTGASTAIVQVIGDYNAKKDHTFTFTAIQTGEIGSDHPVQLRWRDETGRSGLLQLDSLNYAPGSPVDLVDGLSLVFSKGDVIVGDTFSFQAHTTKSDLFWWVSPQDRLAGFSQPTNWTRQATYGAPVVEGPYTGSDPQHFTLTVEGSGQVGTARGLRVLWKASGGESGLINIGDGYTAGSKLALTDGVTATINPGVLTEGQQATFRVSPQETSGKWWLSDQERSIPAEVLDVSKWSTTGVEGQGGQMPPLPIEAGPRTSSSKTAVTGTYTGDETKVYTFTAERDGAIGTTKDLRIRWEDDKGHSGELKAGEEYSAGAPLPFDSGLSISFGPGRVFKDDQFTVRTRTSTIQPPQDASIRFGATELGGGLEISSSSNELENVVEGVKLSLLSVDPKPVTITIKGDTEKAAASVLEFTKQVNEFAAVVSELSKYDRDTNTAGPLQANREVVDIKNRLFQLLVDPVAGLPKTSNMLFTLGVRLNDKGLLAVDENTLKQKVEDNFAAVADLFRDKGETSNNSVAFVGMSDTTQVSSEGYPVDVRQVASQGSYLSPPLLEPLIVTQANNKLYVLADGKRSDEILLDTKSYSVAEYARALQNRITNDKQVGTNGVRVIVEGDRIRVLSGQFGKRSSIGFEPNQGGQAPVGLMNGETVGGRDVQGSIGGQEAEGNGQLMRVKDTVPNVGGIRLLVKLNDSQLKPAAPEAVIKITRGVASRLNTFLAGQTDPLKGDLKRTTDGLRNQVKNLDEQLTRMEERIQTKRRDLQDKFSRLESQMSKLKSQQSYMSGQLASIGTGGGGSSIVNKLLG